MNIRTFSLLIIVVAATSCASVKIKKDRYAYLDKNNNSGLNGTYSNVVAGGLNKYNGIFWLEVYESKDGYQHYLDSASVNVNVVNDELVELSLNVSGSALKKVQLKGKFKNGVFSVKKKNEFDFYVVAWAFHSKKMCIALTKENDIALISSSGSIALLIVMPIGGTGDNNVESIFKRLH